MSKQKKVEGKRSDEVIYIDGNNTVISTEAKDRTTSSSSTIPSLFNRLKEQKNPTAQSVPELPLSESIPVEAASTSTSSSSSSTIPNLFNHLMEQKHPTAQPVPEIPLSESIPIEITSTKESEMFKDLQVDKVKINIFIFYDWKALCCSKFRFKRA